MSDIAKCPNPECGLPCKVWDIHDEVWFVRCVPREADIDEHGCNYAGPAAKSSSEAIRLHNLVCGSKAIAAVPVGDLKELVDAWQASAALIMRVDADSSLRLEARAYRGCADRLRALIERHRKEQK